MKYHNIVQASIVLLLVVTASAQAPAVKAVGTVKSVNGNSVILTTDSGHEMNVTFADAARIVLATPGQTDLKNATPIQISDIQVGDRVLARGAGEGNAVIASSAVVMKKSDIAQRQQHEHEEWRRGVGGIVKSVDAAAQTIILANALVASGEPIVIRIAKDTSIRRYAPDSIKFDEAKPGTLDQIQPGDQLRARGTKNAHGTEFTAQAIVSGTFRDIAGTVVTADVASNSITIMDLATKKPTAVKVSSDSQLRKLPPFVAQMIATRLKGGTAGEAPAAAGAPGQREPPGGSTGSRGGQGNLRGAGNGPGSTGSGAPAEQGGNWRGDGGPPDFQQMLSRMPAVAISDLQKGDAVMLVATEGSSTSAPTAITLLAGVEPILSAVPGGTNASMILSPWNLGTNPAGASDAAAQ